MAWSKLFQNFTWKNKNESKTTPLGATNLNAINTAIDGIDDRLVDLTSDAAEVGMIYAEGIRDDTGGQMQILSDDSLEIWADSDIDLVSDSGKVNYNGVEIATKAKVGASSTDLNTLTSEGMYQIQNPNNAPSGVTGWVTLSVVPTSNDSTYCRQMLYIPSSDNIYTRNNAGSTWGSWNKLATKSDLTNGFVPFSATTSAVDLNDYTACGFYSTNNASNRPSDVTGYATVLVIPINNDAAYCRQLLFPVKANSAYSRYCDGGNWSSWTRLH